MKRLRALGFIQNQPEVGLAVLRRDYKDKHHQFDLKHFFLITPEGRQYLQLREAVTEDAETEV